MDQSSSGLPSRGHTRNKSAAKASRPRSSTKGPLDIDDTPLASPTGTSSSQAKRLSANASQHASPRTSTNLSRTRSPGPRASASRPETPGTAPAPVPALKRDLSFLLKPEIYHQISPLSVPAPFRVASRQPAPDTPMQTLVAQGHFRAAAAAAAQELTSGAVSPTDHARIFDLLYIRLSSLCLLDALPLAAQEAKVLEDLNSSSFYAQSDLLDSDSSAPGAAPGVDPETHHHHHHLAPWALRTLVVRLQTIGGFGDPRRAVMSYFDLAREARSEAAGAAAAHDHSGAELWKRRLADLGVRVAGALVEMDDLAGAAAHLASLPDAETDSRRLAMSRALLWLHIGDVDAARRCVGQGQGQDAQADVAVQVVDALADMADGEYDAALGKWRALREGMARDGVEDEMVGVNLAVCLLYTGRMAEGRDLLEDLVSAGQTSHTLLFNLTTMYELCSDRARALKTRLAERVAAETSSRPGGAWEKTNADFKL
ncbi:hypothetical protein F5Y14DRAFT_417912 [Nemania sp. NC0429]|nr:hypothetical protein F5Y14DRAFT_417912 [Nemania sp. NC0429]